MEAKEKELLGSFFNFLKDKEDREVPLRAQFTFTPDSIDWEGLKYDIEDLNLIKNTDSMDNIVWDKVDQSNFEVLNWVIKNAGDNVDLENIDINREGILPLLGKHAADSIPWDKVKINSYSDAMLATRIAKDKINWNEQVDFTQYPTVKFLHMKEPGLIDKSNIDTSDEKFAKLLDKVGNK